MKKYPCLKQFNFSYIAALKRDNSHLIGPILHKSYGYFLTVIFFFSWLVENILWICHCFSVENCVSSWIFSICFWKFLLPVKISQYQVGKVNVVKCLPSAWVSVAHADFSVSQVLQPDLTVHNTCWPCYHKNISPRTKTAVKIHI